MNGRALLAPLLLPLALAACASLPSSGPTANQVTGPLSESNIELVDIQPATPSPLPYEARPLAPWLLTDAPTRGGGIAPGDVLRITVYEAGYSLFSGTDPETGIARPGQASAQGFPPVVVPEGGTIRFPYAGTIRAAGRSAAEVATEIEARLRGKSQAAQVVVAVEPGPRRAVTLSGAVKKPGRVALTEADERLLDAVALADGPEARAADTIVTLTRGTASSSLRLDELTVGSMANVILSPGDRIELVRSPRTMTVMGAAGSVSELPFDDSDFTLSEALARAGGAKDEKADPTGVFVFRLEARPGREGAVPVIYRLNLLQPQSYFAAQRFAMREKDVMLVANARANQVGKFVQMLNAVIAPALTVDLLTR